MTHFLASPLSWELQDSLALSVMGPNRNTADTEPFGFPVSKGKDRMQIGVVGKGAERNVFRWCDI